MYSSNFDRNKNLIPTSNQKYIKPLDPIYWRKWTPLYTLDGNKIGPTTYSKTLDLQKKIFSNKNC